MEIVDESSIVGEIFHYLSHHAVLLPDKATTKICIVYDRSVKEKKGHLNENQFRGPVLLEDLG